MTSDAAYGAWLDARIAAVRAYEDAANAAAYAQTAYAAYIATTKETVR
jgi:hypothetical protein